MILKNLWRIPFFLFLFGLLLGGSASAQDLIEHDMASEVAPLGGPIPGQFIVVLNDDVSNPRGVAAELARAHGLSLGFTYSRVIKGFSAQVPAQALAALSLDPRVAYVEQNERAFVTTLPPIGVRRISADLNPNITINGQDDTRIDVDVAVVDTGIDLDHPDLDVVASVRCARKGGGFFGPVQCDEGQGNDDNWHGTHVSGTIAALDNGPDITCTSCTPNETIDVVGVAPGARLWAVKVLDSSGNGTTETILAGLDWVAAREDQIEVVNASLGFNGHVQSVCDAISTLTGYGLIFSVAAGNGNESIVANSYSPADCIFDNPNMFVVSALADFNGAPNGGAEPYHNLCASETDDTLATFSASGLGVNITAPGVCVISTKNDGGHNVIASGTSQAAPHVAGAAALLASGPQPCSQSPDATELPCAPTSEAGVALIVGEILNSGNTNWTDNSGDSKHEPLLDVNDNVFAPATVAVSGGGNNQLPIADAGSDQTVTDTDSSGSENVVLDGSGSMDPDGTIQSYAWIEGGTQIAGGVNPTVPFVVGTHTITLQVTDNDGATDSDQVVVTVDPPSGAGGGISLSATGYKVKGMQTVDLTWGGAASTNVDVYRDGIVRATTANDGSYTDNINQRGSGSYIYKVCEAGTATCSGTATVGF